MCANEKQTHDGGSPSVRGVLASTGAGDHHPLPVPVPLFEGCQFAAAALQSQCPTLLLLPNLFPGKEVGTALPVTQETRIHTHIPGTQVRGALVAIAKETEALKTLSK